MYIIKVITLILLEKVFEYGPSLITWIPYYPCKIFLVFYLENQGMVLLIFFLFLTAIKYV